MPKPGRRPYLHHYHSYDRCVDFVRREANVLHTVPIIVVVITIISSIIVIVIIIICIASRSMFFRKRLVLLLPARILSASTFSRGMPNGSFLNLGLCRRCNQRNLHFANSDWSFLLCDFCGARLALGALYGVACFWRSEENIGLGHHPFSNALLRTLVEKTLVGTDRDKNLAIKRNLLRLVFTGRPHGFVPVTYQLDRGFKDDYTSTLDYVIFFVF